ncbi:phenylalanine--tRNA ligase subunit alpha [Candidatus Pacearchaeota archaeon ex4484_31]|nr:MAG: phenylalanine--tRNA ligase subunit alpha [Candidatus Pacearchaeota archaeon ex4484_31]
MVEEKKKVLLSLSTLEKKIIPFLHLGSVEKIKKESMLDETSIKRALSFLELKGVVRIKREKKKVVDLGTNGILYKRKGLPERTLLSLLVEKKQLELEEAKRLSNLTENEFFAALGALKEKNFICVERGKIFLKVSKEKAALKFPEEKFLEELPLPEDALTAEQKKLLEKLLRRKEIVKVFEKERISYELTDFGKEIVTAALKHKVELIEELTPEMLKKGKWKGKKFKHYVLDTKVPEIVFGRRHFYLEFLDEIREKFLALGFKEMQGPIVVQEFWNFDALFQPQFHPAREWSDTYRVVNELKLNKLDPKLVNAVKKIHEKKWNYSWSKEKASEVILRPQVTVLSALTLAKIGKNKDKEGKYFAIERCFRPDVVDARHLTEFNQLEGIVIGKELNFKHLLGVLKLIAKEVVDAKENEIRFFPDYYPFTEPSVELNIKFGKEWLEVGGAGIFREEVVSPFIPEAKEEKIRVLAFGLGIDRLAMIKFKLNDIRELFSKNLNFLRKVKCQP